MTRQWPDGSAFIPEVSDEFGGEHSLTGYHRGIDLIGFTWNRAADDGVVVMAGPNDTAGYEVRIRHDDGYQTRYLHNAAGTIRVYVGQRVEQGDVLGAMGDTGYADGKHLHFEVIAPDGVTRIDPRLYVAAGAPAGGSTASFNPAKPATPMSEEDEMNVFLMTCEAVSGAGESGGQNRWLVNPWEGRKKLISSETETVLKAAGVRALSGLQPKLYADQFNG